MSEAPKKIWAEQEYRDWSVDPLDYAYGTELIPYIRADIVDELVAALKICLAGNGYEFDDRPAEAALKKLEEE